MIVYVLVQIKGHPLLGGLNRSDILYNCLLNIFNSALKYKLLFCFKEIDIVSYDLRFSYLFDISIKAGVV